MAPCPSLLSALQPEDLLKGVSSSHFVAQNLSVIVCPLTQIENQSPQHDCEAGQDLHRAPTLRRVLLDPSPASLSLAHAAAPLMHSARSHPGAFALAVLMLLHGSCPHFLHVLTPFHASPSHEVFLATRIFSFSTLPIPFLLDFFFYLFSTVFSAAKANILPVLFTALSSAHSAALVHNMRSVLSEGSYRLLNQNYTRMYCVI